jgi:hypothetical protein
LIGPVSDGERISIIGSEGREDDLAVKTGSSFSWACEARNSLWLTKSNARAEAETVRHTATQQVIQNFIFIRPLV